MWELVERDVPDFVGAACPNIIQIVWCWQWVVVQPGNSFNP